MRQTRRLLKVKWLKQAGPKQNMTQEFPWNYDIFTRMAELCMFFTLVLTRLSGRNNECIMENYNVVNEN